MRSARASVTPLETAEAARTPPARASAPPEAPRGALR